MKRTTIFILLIVCFIFSNFAQQNLIYTHPDALFNQGKELYSERKYAASFRIFEEFLAATEIIQAGQQLEADFYLAANAFYLRSDDAEARLEMHITKFPYTPFFDETNYMRGMLAYDKKRYSRALKLFSEVNADNLNERDRLDFLFYKGYALIEEKRFNEANTIYLRLKNMDTRYNVSATYYYGYTEYMLERYETALPEFISIRENPEYSNIVPYYIIQIYYNQRDFEKVKSEAASLLKNNPDNKNNAEVYRILGEIAYEEKDYKSAITNLKNYERIFPQVLRNDMYLLGLSYFYTNDYRNSVQYLSKVTTEKDTITENGYLYLGNAYIHLGDKENARMSYEAALRTNFNPAVREEAMFNYALTSYETTPGLGAKDENEDCESCQKRNIEQTTALFGQSIKAFEQFIKEYPNSPHIDESYNYLSSIYLSTQDYQAAYNSIQLIRKPNAQMLETKQYLLYRLGIQAYNQNSLDKAIDQFTLAIQATKYGKYTAECYYWRSDCYYRTNQPLASAADLKEFFADKNAKQSKNYVLAHYGYGYAYFAQKLYSDALGWFVKYTNLETDKKVNNTTYADALNRIGDCYFTQRNFTNAAQYYSQAANANPKGADYAMFQSGYVMGLQKNYDGKITRLEALVRDFPRSEYAPAALYEIGRSYIMKENNDRAISTYNRLIQTYPNSAMARKGALEIGMVYNNQNKTDDAIKAYKSVIEKHYGSEEAYAALEALEAIYIDKNDVNAYLDYTGKLGPDMGKRTSTYADSISYLAAERRYLNRNYSEVIVSMSEYVNKYCPGGRDCINARYYLADSYYQTGDKDNALKEFRTLLEGGVNQFTEVATMRCAEITFDQKDYQSSLRYFRQLQNLAQTTENKNVARLGVLRSSYFINDYKSTVAVATEIISDENASASIKAEARYNRAKAYLALNENDKAAEDLKIISQNTQTANGAEAKYLLAKYYFDKNESDKAENEIFDFTQKGTSHQYWMARSLVLLADISIQRKDDFQAKQYLLSLQRNYTVADDIQGMIIERLDAISIREKTNLIN